VGLGQHAWRSGCPGSVRVCRELHYGRYEAGIIGFFFIAAAMGVLGLMMGARGKEQGQEKPRSSPV